MKRTLKLAFVGFMAGVFFIALLSAIYLFFGYAGKCTTVIDSWPCSYSEYLVYNGRYTLGFGGALSICFGFVIALVIILMRLVLGLFAKLNI